MFGGMQWLIDLCSQGGGGPPAGSIFLWWGTVLDVPAGYVICDGNNGTPDLRGKFLICSNVPYPPGVSGGSASHSHQVPTANHSHALQGGLGLGGSGKNDPLTGGPLTYPNSTSDTQNHLPPYYSLWYIMKT
jgi:hypothetical protein